MSEGLRAPRRMGFGDTCSLAMSAKEKAALCSCGHLGSEHQHPLPAPCRNGWDDVRLRKVIDAAASDPISPACGLSIIDAMETEMERQRALGACPCIAFSPVGNGGTNA